MNFKIYKLKGRSIRQMLDEDVDGGGGLWHVDTSRENGIIHVCNLKMAFIGFRLDDKLYLEPETIEGWDRLKRTLEDADMPRGEQVQ
jgi:hypothetical protein